MAITLWIFLISPLLAMSLCVVAKCCVLTHKSWTNKYGKKDEGRTCPEIGKANLKCALCTFTQQSMLKVRVRCRISTVLVSTSLYCVFRDMQCNLNRMRSLTALFTKLPARRSPSWDDPQGPFQPLAPFMAYGSFTNCTRQNHGMAGTVRRAAL